MNTDIITPKGIAVVQHAVADFTLLANNDDGTLADALSTSLNALMREMGDGNRALVLLWSFACAVLTENLPDEQQ